MKRAQEPVRTMKHRLRPIWCTNPELKIPQILGHFLHNLLHSHLRDQPTPDAPHGDRPNTIIRFQ
ncbi:hypothetical protein Hanom_Chr05g00435181 [Helianthus anomalus]